MKEDLHKDLKRFEEIARGIMERTDYINDVAKKALKIPPIEQPIIPKFFIEHYPSLSKLGSVQVALDRGLFPEEAGLAKKIEAYCEPFRSAQALIDCFNRSLNGLMGTGFSNFVKMDRYVNNMSKAMRDALAPALKINAINVEGISTSLIDGWSVIDTSWMSNKAIWAVDVEKVLSVSTKGIEQSSISTLFELEQETSRIMLKTCSLQLTSIAAQVASIVGARSIVPDRWKEVVAPFALLEDLQEVAIRQHQRIQREGNASEWRLGLLNGISRFADRQVAWTSEIFSELKDQIEDDESDVEDIEETSAVALIPQYIGYTKRANVDITPEEGLENSVIVEITEKGKQISGNIVRINELCEVVGKEKTFKYTDKLVSKIMKFGNLICSTNEFFGAMIDGFYMIFYENLEHIKRLSSEETVRNGDVYQCIFRVKHMRTDLRHDYEHGKESDINKKRKTIADCYKHYTNKPALIKQRDYVTLQRKLYDEFLLLEEHLIGILCEEVNQLSDEKE